MLITSRGTRRWVIPKGNPIAGLAPHEAAAHEALEEAGVTGTACAAAIGEYRYFKRRKNGTMREVTVTVFPLAFGDQLDDWLEQDERDTRWFDLADAAMAVDEPDLQRLLAGFSPPPAPPAAGDRFEPALRGTRGATAFGLGLLCAVLIVALVWAWTRLGG